MSASCGRQEGHALCRRNAQMGLLCSSALGCGTSEDSHAYIIYQDQRVCSVQCVGHVCKSVRNYGL
jgi:hypothetical protein